MGSPVFVTVANLVIEDVESRALFTYPVPLPFWKGYICGWHMDSSTLDMVRDFHKCLNSIETTIQFTTKMESEGTLLFLDTRITPHTGSLSTTVFRKNAQVLRLPIPSPLSAQGGSGPPPVWPCWDDLLRLPRYRERKETCCKGAPEQWLLQKACCEKLTSAIMFTTALTGHMYSHSYPPLYLSPTVPVTSYLCFYAELPSRHSGELCTVECRIPLADSRSLEETSLMYMHCICVFSSADCPS